MFWHLVVGSTKNNSGISTQMHEDLDFVALEDQLYEQHREDQESKPLKSLFGKHKIIQKTRRL